MRKRSRRNGGFRYIMVMSAVSLAIAAVTVIIVLTNVFQPDAIASSAHVTDTEQEADDNADNTKDKNDAEYKQKKETVESDRIYKNIFIEDTDVSDLTREEAKSRVAEDILNNLKQKSITLKLSSGTNDKEYSMTFADFAILPDFTKVVEEAYAYARNGSLDDRYKQIDALKDKPLKLKADDKNLYARLYTDTGIEAALSGIADEILVEPLDAQMHRQNGEFVITPEKAGSEMDMEATVKAVKKTLEENSSGNSVVYILTKVKNPTFTSADCEQSKSVIGSFTTKIAPGSEGRLTNIKTAASKINDNMIKPEDVFSTNEAFGPSTTENGYAIGKVIIDGKLVDDIGGGVCQVSSTLYNAILFSELKVVERQNHSLKVGYVDYGFDATLAGDYIDFKFKNDTEHPVYIECYIENSKVICNIYGKETRDPKRTLKFTNELVEKVEPAPEEVTEDPTLPLGERVADPEAKTGYRYRVYKNIYQDGKFVSKEQVNTSYYKPVVGKVRVGTGPAKPAEPTQTAPENTPQPTQVVPEWQPDNAPTPMPEQVPENTGDSNDQEVIPLQPGVPVMPE